MPDRSSGDAGGGERSAANAALLLGGQLVSSLGDAVYRLAIGFWILEETGSTALTGLVLAAAVLPKALLSPLAGAVADRRDRKSILVVSDLLCGAVSLLVGVLAVTGTLEAWMLPAAALLMGTGGAFFGPALEAALPDLASVKKLPRLNAAFSFTTTGAAIFGNTVGGLLFTILGAPILFIANGVSFILSAFSESFARLPRPPRSGERGALLDDLKAGLTILRSTPGVLPLLSTAGIANLLFGGIFVLLMAMCDERADLGPSAYGFMMGAMGAGALAGYLFSSAVAVPQSRRGQVYLSSGVLKGLLLSAVPLTSGAIAPAALMGLVGVTVSLDSVTLTTALQTAVPAGDRGKLLGSRAALMSVLSPVGMLSAGWLAQGIHSKVLVCTFAAMIAVSYVVAGLVGPVRKALSPR